jgi:osmotically-inducible protein OsmY
MLKAKPMFLSTLQPSASFSFGHDHGISMEKTAIETELSYLRDFDGSNLSVDVTGDYIVLEGVVTSNGDHARVLRIAHELVGYDRVLSRIVVCSAA